MSKNTQLEQTQTAVHNQKPKPIQTPEIGIMETEQWNGLTDTTSGSILDLPESNARPLQQAQILRMQEQHGNAYVQRFLQNRPNPHPTHINHVATTPATPSLTHPIQTKLSVNEPDDAYEKEADAVADTIMRMPAPASPPPPNDEDNKTAQSSISRVQRKKDSVSGQEVAPDIESRIASVQSSGGKPLPDSERDFFEPRMGADLSDVRIHDGETAVQTARDLNAKAYTVGSDIVFNKGEYAPGSDSGRKLLAHELTHTIQQGATIQTKRIQRQEGDGDGLEEIRELVNLIPTVSIEALYFAWAEISDGGAGLISIINANPTLWEESVRYAPFVWLAITGTDETVIEYFNNNWSLLEESNGSAFAGDYYDEIPAVQLMQQNLEDEVYALTRHYLTLNEEYVLEEFGLIGADPEGEATTELDEEHIAYLEELQEAARQIQEARRAQDQMQQMVIGYFELSGYNYLDEDGEIQTAMMPVTFMPNNPPNLPPTGEEPSPMATWEEVQEMYDLAEAVIDIFRNSYPAIFALDEQGRINEFAEAGSPNVAQDIAGDSLNVVLTNIRETRPKIGSDVQFRDLAPIYQQLLSNTQIDYTPETDWTQVFAQNVAINHIQAGDGLSFWEILGIGLTLASIVVMPLSVLAATTMLVVATGANVYQAVQSWEQYQTLAQAADSNIQEELEIVSDQTVTAAFGRAILDTVFAFIDVFMLGADAVRAWRSIRALGIDNTRQLLTAAGGVDNLVSLVGRINGTGTNIAEYIRILGGADEFTQTVLLLGVDNTANIIARVGTQYGDDLIYVIDCFKVIDPTLLDDVTIPRVQVAYDFYIQQGFSPNGVSGHIRGIDITQNVDVITVPQGTYVYQWQFPGGSQGSYYAIDSSVTPSELGIRPEGLGADGALVDRVQSVYVASSDVQVLQSTADSVLVNWDGINPEFLADGGAIQWFTTSTDSFTLVSPP